jgi:hypothetical protein
VPVRSVTIHAARVRHTSFTAHLNDDNGSVHLYEDPASVFGVQVYGTAEEFEVLAEAFAHAARSLRQGTTWTSPSAA